MNNNITQQEEERKHGDYPIAKFDLQIEDFLNQYDNINTKENYEIVLKDFFKYLENQNEIAIFNSDNVNRLVLGYKDYLNSKILADKTINQYLTNLNTFFKFLNFNNVKTHLKKIGHSNIDKYKYITRDELNELVKTVDIAIDEDMEFKQGYYKKHNKGTYKGNKNLIRNKAILLSLFFTGARVTELINIKLKNIHFKDNYLILHGKGNTIYEQGFNNQVKSILKKLIAIENITDSESYIFINQQRKQMTRERIRQLIKEIAKDTDKRLQQTDNEDNLTSRATPHSFRHGLANYLLNTKKWDINKVRNTLRHSNIAVTNNYLTTNKKELKKLQNQID